jgi:hypothetical protein
MPHNLSTPLNSTTTMLLVDRMKYLQLGGPMRVSSPKKGELTFESKGYNIRSQPSSFVPKMVLAQTPQLVVQMRVRAQD